MKLWKRNWDINDYFYHKRESNSYELDSLLSVKYLIIRCIRYYFLFARMLYNHDYV